jgi:hypothetical protein
MQGFSNTFECQSRQHDNKEHWAVSTSAMYEELQNCKSEAGRHQDEVTSLRNKSCAKVGLLNAFQDLSETN